MKYLTTILLSFIGILSAYGQVDDDVMANDEKTVAGPAKAAAAESTMLLFDVNGDGVVNAIDVVDIIKYTRGAARSAFNVKKADTNGDGKVNIDDAKALSRLMTGGEMPSWATAEPEKPDQPENPEQPENSEQSGQPNVQPDKPIVIYGSSAIDPDAP